MNERDSEAMNLISQCAQAYSGNFAPTNDLPNGQNVASYSPNDAQKKYVHMYFSKQVTLWSSIREKLGKEPAQVVYSVGAGPMLDLLGWFWDAPRTEDTKQVVAADVLEWSAIRALPEWSTLVERLVGTYSYVPGVVVPDRSSALQCTGLGLKDLPSSAIPDCATVLFPFILNHLLGAQNPMGATGGQALAAWVVDVLTRDGRLVIADMTYSEKTKDFWATICTLFNVSQTPTSMNFKVPLAQMKPLYRDGQDGRRCSHYMSEATVLVLEKGKSFFLS